MVWERAPAAVERRMIETVRQRMELISQHIYGNVQVTLNDGSATGWAGSTYSTIRLILNMRNSFCCYESLCPNSPCDLDIA
jgi:hypothetical protein